MDFRIIFTEVIVNIHPKLYHLHNLLQGKNSLVATFGERENC